MIEYSLYTDTLFNRFFMSSLGGARDPLFAGLDERSALTGGFIGPSAEAAPDGTGFDHFAAQEHESYALFAQFDYQFTDKLTLTAGIRYTDESKDIATEFSEHLPGGQTFPTFFSSTTELAIRAAAGAALVTLALHWYLDRHPLRQI
jgi:iron complex outermembrane receptor protein